MKRLLNRWILSSVVLLVLSLPIIGVAQKKKGDAPEKHKKDSLSLFQNLKNTRIGKEISRSVTRKTFSDSVKQERSEDKFIPYEGKIIRRIYIDHIGLDRSIYNPEKNIKSVVTRIAKSLHTNTRPKIIKQHLFFYEGKQLNPYKLADNERYLRDLDFILDSRIIVKKATEDSVDVFVITRDVFSLGGSVNPSGPTKSRFGLYDANLMGNAQRVDARVLLQTDRTPRTGYSANYRKSSFMGSLINVTLGYTQLDNGSSYGTENEYAYYIRLDRPLVSPYSRWAGGVELSRNWSKNIFQSPDSLFLNYRYNVQDYWAGYNMGVNTNMNDRTRHFVALRYFQQHFLRQPAQPNELTNALYNNRQMVLGSFTFYEQNFYKTHYVFGFGRTEDIPYGTTATLTTGYSKELNRKRPYVSGDFTKSFVRKNGNFYTLRAGAGGYPHNRLMEDAVVLASANFYSKLFTYKKLKLRQSFEVGYTEMFNNVTNPLLTLSGQVRGFRPDSLFGYRRIYAQSETTYFSDWSLLGFRFAPFTAFEGALFRQKVNANKVYVFYPGFSAGVRTRNENLIFGTMEFRVYMFPITVPGVGHFQFKFTSNLRFKYSGSFIKAPALLNYN